MKKYCKKLKKIKYLKFLKRKWAETPYYKSQSEHNVVIDGSSLIVHTTQTQLNMLVRYKHISFEKNITNSNLTMIMNSNRTKEICFCWKSH